jgi:hypothetical protein
VAWKPYSKPLFAHLAILRDNTFDNIKTALLFTAEQFLFLYSDFNLWAIDLIFNEKCFSRNEAISLSLPDKRSAGFCGEYGKLVFIKLNGYRATVYRYNAANFRKSAEIRLNRKGFIAC